MAQLVTIENFPLYNYCYEQAVSWFARSTKEKAEQCVKEFPELFRMSCYSRITRGGQLFLGSLFTCSLHKKVD